ncbi:hypothetical protein VR7878_02674 [Vibrio ruber DSM 16370]|uniref:Uncharacterized protein n=1 Tax=Vibrio ruber (strain DSM 16370 / JCM 11486 / BCRC 17186 / CECT 7878 / LMG 23124 / VR1) TaxID=1123498 RepID=A0A1R4LNW1_VIBR1|nr:DUF943 family protein [Vibrio ruber]SJN58143.1 hypothetical protein VR7878_02674 [Vibrio ruber DSM 16370]
MSKKLSFVIMLLVCGMGYGVYLWLLPVQIIDVHQKNNWTSVVVKNFPVTQQRKIDWWDKNKDYLKEHYDVPKPNKNGHFDIIFWDIGSGYKVDQMTDEDSDLLCFSDMKTSRNCIEKKRVFWVSLGRNGGLQFR